MKFSEFRRYSPASKSHIYVFVCEDDFLVEESKAIWERIFGGEWVFEKYSAKEFAEIDMRRLLDEALTAPLFSIHRGFIVIDASGLSQARLKDLEAIQALPQSSLKIILRFNSRRLNHPLGKIFPLIEIDSLKPPEVVRWLNQQYAMAPEVARHLVDSLGTDLYLLRTEVERLKTYVGPNHSIESEDIDRLTLRSEQFGAFEFDDALLGRDYKKAVRVVAQMFEEGMEPIILLSRTTRVWRQLFIGKALAGRKSAKDVATAAAVPSWKANDFVACCRNFEWDRIVRGFRSLLDADRAFKTSTPNPEHYFEVMLWKLIQ